MRSRRCVVPGVLALATLCFAAVPPRKTEDLRRDAMDIVVGEVRFVYAGELRVEHGTDTRYCIEVAVAKVEKPSGDATARPTTAPSTQPAARIVAGHLIYARCWRPSKRPDGWAGHQGQNLIPKPGQRVRLYLTREPDGGLDVLEPNGIEVVTE
jgi:hypothetical protein